MNINMFICIKHKHIYEYGTCVLPLISGERQFLFLIQSQPYTYDYNDPYFV